VRVGVEGDPDLCVPQERLHHLRVDTLRKQQRRRGVTQGMEPDPWEAGNFEQRQERSAHHVRLPQRSALLATEDKAVCPVMTLGQHPAPVIL
jgi:hypothetical protein